MVRKSISKEYTDIEKIKNEMDSGIWSKEDLALQDIINQKEQELRTIQKQKDNINSEKSFLIETVKEKEKKIQLLNQNIQQMEKMKEDWKKDLVN